MEYNRLTLFASSNERSNSRISFSLRQLFDFTTLRHTRFKNRVRSYLTNRDLELLIFGAYVLGESSDHSQKRKRIWTPDFVREIRNLDYPYNAQVSIIVFSSSCSYGQAIQAGADDYLPATLDNYPRLLTIAREHIHANRV